MSEIAQLKVLNEHIADYRVVNKSQSVLYSMFLPDYPLKLNSTGKFVFETIRDSNSIELSKLVQTVSLRYQVNEEIVYSDIISLLQKMWLLGFVDWIDSNPLRKNFKTTTNEGVILHLTVNDCEKYFGTRDDGFVKLFDPYTVNELQNDITYIKTNILISKYFPFAMLSSKGECVAKLILQFDNVNGIAYPSFLAYKAEINPNILCDFIIRATRIVGEKWGLVETDNNKLITLLNTTSVSLTTLEQFGLKKIATLSGEINEELVDLFAL